MVGVSPLPYIGLTAVVGVVVVVLEHGIPLLGAQVECKDVAVPFRVLGVDSGRATPHSMDGRGNPPLRCGW